MITCSELPQDHQELKISVISPVYNVADYIVETLHSLHRQTLSSSDFEVILVDDHGADDSIARAEAFAREHGWEGQLRILQTPQNSGPGIARNIGLQHARGKYIAFVDSDDLLCPEALQQIYEAAEAAEADVAYCQVQYYGGPKDKKVVRNPRVHPGLLSDQGKKDFLVSFKTFCYAFIYRRDFLMEHQLLFPKERSSEDTYFLTQVLLYVQRMVCVDLPLYLYRIRPASLTTVVNPHRWRDKLSAFSKLMDDLHRRGCYARYSFEIDYIYLKKAYMVGALNYLSSVERGEATILAEMRSEMQRQVPQWRCNPYLRRSLKFRLLMWLLNRPSSLTLRLLPKLLRSLNVAL